MNKMSYSARFPIAADDLDTVLTTLLGQPWRIITADDGRHDTKTAAPIVIRSGPPPFQGELFEL
jgi:hypothetical protein